MRDILDYFLNNPVVFVRQFTQIVFSAIILKKQKTEIKINFIIYLATS